MLIDVTKYHGGICPGATLVRHNAKTCEITCEEVPEDGMIEVSACCNPLIEMDMTPCPEFEEQVDCGPCSHGCGCDSSTDGEGAETVTLEQVEAIVSDCIAKEIETLEADKAPE